MDEPTKKPTHRLDVLGFFCPVPVAEAKQALSSLSEGSVLEVLASDPETLHDIPMMIERTSHQIVDVKKSQGEFTFLIEVRSRGN
ncbi:MAG: sulfurtransferase TusA family protein [Candidatus Poseidoniaceae archaeon]|jgi:tRNA 2-thiouridine synthesizing protein A